MKMFRNMAIMGTFLGLSALSGLDALALSVKTFGMAGTGTAYAQDAFAAGYNPANGVDIENRWDAELFGVYDRGHQKTSNNFVPGTPFLNPFTNGKFDTFRHSRYIVVPNFGINYNLNCNVAVGLVSYNRNRQKTTFKHPNVLVGSTPLGLEYVNQTVSPYISYKWCDFNFGISLNWQVQRLKANGIQRFATSTFSSHPTDVTNKGYNYANGIGVSIGTQWSLTDCFKIGFVYTPRTHMGRFKKYKGLLADTGRFDVPERVNFGLSYRFIPCATFCFDYERQAWKKVVPLHNKLQTTTLDLVINKLGSKTGSGFGWRDQHFYRFGLDYAFNDKLLLRVGYRTVNFPHKGNQNALNIITNDIVNEYLTTGFTYTWNCANEFSFCFLYGFQNGLKGPNAIPAFLGGGNTDLEAQKIAIGISWGHNF
jgi:long-chain fatty acid transport protein